MYTGSDVKEALTASQKAGSVKSNLSGTGYEMGQPVTIGCSYKGRVWSREQGPVPRFIRWCAGIGKKLIDESIDTSAIIENVLIPEEVDTLPDATLLALEWPMEIIRQSQERVLLKWSTEELPLSLFDLTFACERRLTNELSFTVSSDAANAEYVLRLGGTRGFQVVRKSGKRFAIRIGRIEKPLEEYLSDYPPLARFTDMSELDGNLLVRPKDRLDLTLPAERFEPWDWKGTNISQESLWKGGKRRPNSIQGRAADHFREGGFELIFDDDHKGEAADLVCMKEEDESIRLALVHCKFSGDADPGKRISDVVEVCSQAVRSAKWVWRFRDLCRHITVREKRLRKPNRTSRFLAGEAKTLNQFLRMSRFKDVRAEIVIVQPGLSQGSCSAEQMSVLAAADSFLTETVGVHLDVVCSE
jgi:hypothetical protein